MKAKIKERPDRFGKNKFLFELWSEGSLLVTYGSRKNAEKAVLDYENGYVKAAKRFSKIRDNLEKLLNEEKAGIDIQCEGGSSGVYDYGLELHIQEGRFSYNFKLSEETYFPV